MRSKPAIIHHELCIHSKEVTDDIRSAAWLESELHPELDRHRRHQMADICEGENAESVWRVLGVSEAQLRLSMLRILLPQRRISHANDLRHPKCWKFRMRVSLPTPTICFIKEKIHEYMVASVMADRTAVIIPPASAIWQTRAAEVLTALSGVSATVMLPSGPVRRPIWPL